MKLSTRTKKRPFARRTSGTAFGRRSLNIEPLESRAMLSASPGLDGIMAQPTLTNLASVTNTSPRGYTPSQILSAYGFNQITFSNGTVSGNGSGQTIAIVDAYDDPNIASDLQTFDRTFGLANPASFTEINENGGSSLPQASASWSEEIALDVEWAHAIAPGANIVLVEASSSSVSDLLAAVNTARNLSNVSVVSMSWGAGEFQSETQYDQYFTTPAGHTGITFVASSGDNGAGTIWPSVSPNVVSVGGTSLNVSSSSYAGESAWNGSGGGYSSFESEPSFQGSVQSAGVRTSPDVAYDANPNTGFAVYDSMATGGQSGWFQIGGTSAGAPQWAGLFAIADQGRALAGKATIAGGQTAVYNLPSSDFHDVTSGSNGYSAQAGYDLVTGRGTPIANSVVNALVTGTTSSSSTGSTGSGASGSTPTSGSTSPTPTPTPPSHYHYYYELIYYHGRWYIVEVSAPDAMTASGNNPASGADLNPVAASLTTAATNSSETAGADTSSSETATSSSLSVQTNTATVSTTSNFVVARPSNGAGGRAATDDTAIESEAPPTDPDSGSRSEPDSLPPEESSTTTDPATDESSSFPSLSTEADSTSDDGGHLMPLAVDACFSDAASLLPMHNELAILPESFGDWRQFDLTALAIAVIIAANRRSEGTLSPQPRHDRRIKLPQHRLR